ncbi:MAG: glycosyltransferase [Alphaproteobacteria bacterium]|nr:glycosyltransferase [Alphaproteobacteria bacterium]
MTGERVLHLSWYGPEPADSGERVRLARISEQLNSEFAVSLIELEHVSDRRVGRRYRIPRWKYVSATLRRRAIEEEMLATSRLRRYVENLIHEVRPSVIVCNQPWGIPTVPKEWHSRMIVDTHNVNSARLQRLSEGFGRFDPRRYVLKDQARLSLSFEGRYVAASAQTWAVSRSDADVLTRDLSAQRSKIRIIENGSRFPDQLSPWNEPSGQLRLLFFGSLNYSANVDGIRNALDWMSAVPEALSIQLDIAGSGDGREVQKLVEDAPHANFIGKASDPRTLFAHYDALLVSLRQGAGSRLKVVEAASAGLPILSTSMGIEGFPLVDGTHYLKVEDSSEFVALVGSLVANPRTLDEVRSQAFAALMSLSWDAIGVRARQGVSAVAGHSASDGRTEEL